MSVVMAAVMDANRSAAAQKLPALNNIVNHSDEHRDSAYFSSDTSSKHTSAASFGMNSTLSPTLSGYHQASPATDKTPSPSTALPHRPPLVSPSGGSMSVAAMVSPTSPRIKFERPTSLESGPHSATLAAESEGLSRRESVDSRINQGFNDMRLGNSPYGSHNPSTTSIQNTLNTQRNPRPGMDSLSVNRISNGYQPSADRNPEPSSAKAIRTAPTITGPTVGNIARAAEPTKGQAWAFPEEEPLHRASGTTFLDSRRSSIADSLASSQFTTESRLPPGQRRLDEPTPDYNRLSSNSGEFPSVHHHSLQPKSLGTDDGRSSAAQPYSRTPESRQSHKLAERKRRTEMKELFDQLRDLMPQERGSKASKWEILTKAIHEYQKQTDTIHRLQEHCHHVSENYEVLRQEAQALRLENSQLRGSLGQQNNASGPPAPPSASAAVPPPPTHAPSGPPPPISQPPVFAADPFGSSSREQLPPIRALGSLPGPPGGPDSMTGVQYEARSQSYRSDRF